VVLRQAFRFRHGSPDEVRSFLRSLASSASIEEKAQGFFVFSERPGKPLFTFDCELTSEGLQSERAGEYFAFLGVFVEALTGRFGAVEVEDT
jgi:hypothetical protein